MECLKDLVKRLREEKGLSQRQLALLAETNNTDISNVETGKTKYFRHDFLRKLAKALNVSTLMLLQAAGYIASDEELPPDAILLEELEKKYHAIPVIGRVSAGQLQEAIEHPEFVVPMPPRMNADFVLTVYGDSMEPFYYDGDWVYVKKQPVAENGEHVVARIDDKVTIKIYQLLDHTIILRPANPAYNIISSPNIRVIGIVQGHTSWRKRGGTDNA